MPKGVYIRTEKYKKEVSERNKRLKIKPILIFRGEGKTHPLWKGEKAGYRAKHGWMVKHFGSPGVCEKCKKSGLKGKKIHWANKNGKYRRIRREWMRLCTPCHKKFDLKRLKRLKFYANQPTPRRSKQTIKSTRKYTSVLKVVP